MKKAWLILRLTIVTLVTNYAIHRPNRTVSSTLAIIFGVVAGSVLSEEIRWRLWDRWKMRRYAKLPGPGTFRALVKVNDETYALGHPFYADTAREAAIETQKRAEAFLLETLANASEPTTVIAHYWTERRYTPNTKD